MAALKTGTDDRLVIPLRKPARSVNDSAQEGAPRRTQRKVLTRSSPGGIPGLLILASISRDALQMRCYWRNSLNILFATPKVAKRRPIGCQSVALAGHRNFTKANSVSLPLLNSRPLEKRCHSNAIKPTKVS